MFSFGAVSLTRHSRPRLREDKLQRESRGVAHEAIKLSYFLPVPWIPPYQVRGRLSQARNDNSEGYDMAKGECLFIYVVHYSNWIPRLNRGMTLFGMGNNTVRYGNEIVCFSN
ncbi:MAG TPA: hypothetical protein VJ624_11325 [Thermodesulfobacteriota bacterium]|nr:hypothetical protein [Thermodesulfobacteriota bacterium]